VNTLSRLEAELALNTERIQEARVQMVLGSDTSVKLFELLAQRAILKDMLIEFLKSELNNERRIA
jgi:hypothetical protein